MIQKLVTALGIAALLVISGLSSPAVAQDTELTCEDARCLFQQQIDDACSCDDATNHGQYVKCAGRVIREITKANPELGNCRGRLVRCAARSTCGKAGFVTCIRPTELGTCDATTLVCSAPVGQICATNDDCVVATKCSTKRSAEKCTERGGTVGVTATCCSNCESPPTTVP